jgi:hypothetical protein
VGEPDDIAGAITDNTPGDKVGVELRRGANATTDDVTVTLAQRPQGPR